jgi:Tfp pilus assembly protein PilO
MPDLRGTRQKVQIALVGLVVVDVIVVGLLFSPLVGSAKARNEQQQQLRMELIQKDRQVKPLGGLDKKIITAQHQIDGFYKDRLPAQDSAISESLGKLASQSGVKIGTVKYSQKDAEVTDLRRVLIDADLSGDYLQLVRFINGLERSQVFFLVDSVDLGGEQGGVVKLQMKLETYLRTGA